MDRRVKERLIGATILLVLVILVVPELLSGPKGRGGSPPLPPAAGVAPAGSLRNVTVDLATSQATSAADSAAPAAPAPAAPAGRPSDPVAGPTRSDTDALDGATAGGGAAVGEAAPAPSTAGTAIAGERPAASGSAAAPPTITTLKAQQAAPAVLENEPKTPTVQAPAVQAGSATSALPAASSRHGWTVQVGSFASRENAEKLLHRVKSLNPSAHVSPSGAGAALRYRVRIGPLADRSSALRALAKLRKEGVSASLIAP
jgi:DedD protein